MIVVLGSRHDPVAVSLTKAWPGAALCAAEDLTRPGWVWPSPPSRAARWVVDGRVVADDEVSGVFVRRSTVYPEELLSTHPDDRAYLAAEAHAFLVFVLATTRARVANLVLDGGLGEESIRAERWAEAAREVGLAVAPLRVASDRAPSQRWRPIVVEAVGDEVFGAAPAQTLAAAGRLCARLGLIWASFVFDSRQRLLSVTASRPPGRDARLALGRLLARSGPA